ncbi:MAG: SDR family NAD(P)-dependent oxidoreductase [Nitrospirae bacterium]|nr:SDR family NAD(P)-dependent oxidoreductase [Nitrospirota bacterium]
MVCLITGSSRGLGKSVALAFGKRGHRVVVHFKDKKSEADAVASGIKESLALKADVRDFNEVKSLVEKVVRKWGRIDVLVNNAGITKEALLLKTSEKDFDEVVDTNLKGPFNFIRAVAPYMTKQKTKHIINISSIAGIKGKAGLSAYSASKAGLIGLTISAARELSKHNIMVNAVLPGYMLTEMGMASNEKAKELALQDSLVKEFSNPDNVADFICYLSETKGITEQVFNLDSRIL